MKRDKNIKQIVNQNYQTPPKHEIEDAGRRVWKRISAELDKRDTSLRSLYGDGWSAPPLKEREFHVLRAAALLNGKGTLSEIHEAVEARVGRVRPFMVFLTLRRLERRGLLTARESDESGADGKSAPRFQVAEDGERALARARAEGKVFASAGDFVEDGCTEKTQ